MDTSELVPVEVDGRRVLIAVAQTSFEEEVSGHIDANVRTALESAAHVAQVALDSVASMRWKRATVHLGVEFAVESGTLLAVLGKAGAKSSITLDLEFENAARSDA